MLYTMNEIDPKPVDGFSTAKLSLYGLMNVPMVQAENRKHADALFLALPQQVAHLLLSVHNVSRCLHGPISRAGQQRHLPRPEHRGAARARLDQHRADGPWPSGRDRAHPARGRTPNSWPWPSGAHLAG